MTFTAAERHRKRVITDACLDKLSAVAARIGGNPMLVQGPGGNISIKDESEMWVKASGVWLAQALERPIFVPVALQKLCTAADFAVPLDAVIAERNPLNLRPSIETWLHVLMPHRVVVHAHSVGAMAVSVLCSGRTVAADALRGLDWRWIGYRRPGTPLAEVVRDAVGAGRPTVLLLQNHGVVVGGATVEEAEAALDEVERRLSQPLRGFPEPEWSALSALADHDFEAHPDVSAAAMDAFATTLLTAGALLPDQVVFLGGAVPSWSREETLSERVAAIEAKTGVRPDLLLVPGIGALAARDRTPSAESLIQGLFEIVRRIAPGTPTSHIDEAGVGELLGWDAEHYRRVMNATS